MEEIKTLSWKGFKDLIPTLTLDDGLLIIKIEDPKEINISELGSLIRQAPASVRFDFSHTDFSESQIGDTLFQDCPQLISIGKLPSEIEDFSNAFNGCRNLIKVDLGSIVSITNSKNIFKGCSSLKTVVLNKNIINDLADHEGLFEDCYDLTEIINKDFDHPVIINKDVVLKNLWLRGNQDVSGNIVVSGVIYAEDFENEQNGHGFVGNLKGNADTSSKWEHPIDLALGGDVIGTVSIDGSSDRTIMTHLSPGGNIPSKEYLHMMLSKLRVASMQVVDKLPDFGEEGIIYLVPLLNEAYPEGTEKDTIDGDATPNTQNGYEEYIWEFTKKEFIITQSHVGEDGTQIIDDGYYDYGDNSGRYEHIGNTSVNLGDYITNAILKKGYEFEGPVHLTPSDNNSHTLDVGDNFYARKDSTFGTVTRDAEVKIFGHLEVTNGIKGKLDEDIVITEVDEAKDAQLEGAYNGSEHVDIKVYNPDQSVNTTSNVEFVDQHLTGNSTVDGTSDLTKKVTIGADSDDSLLATHKEGGPFTDNTLLKVKGDIDAGNNEIRASYLEGTARDAEKFTEPVNIKVSGDVSGNADLDGTQDIDIKVTIDENGKIVSKAYLKDQLAKLKVGGMQRVTAEWFAKATANPAEATTLGYKLNEDDENPVLLEEGVIYLVPQDSDKYQKDVNDSDYTPDEANSYEEYIWEFNSKTWIPGTTSEGPDGTIITAEGKYDYDDYSGHFEHLGNTDINLKDYVSHTNLKNGYEFSAESGGTYEFGTDKNSTTVTIHGDEHVTNDVDIDGNLNVDGTTTLGPNTEVTVEDSKVSITADTDITSDLTVTGSTTLNGNVEQKDGAVTINGETTVNNNVTVEGTTTLNDNVTITENLTSEKEVALSTEDGTKTVIGAESKEEGHNYSDDGTKGIVYGDFEVKGQIIGNVDTADKVNHQIKESFVSSIDDAKIQQENADGTLVEVTQSAFDGSSEVQITHYKPDQNVNVESDVTFNTVKTTESVNVGTTLNVDGTSTLNAHTTIGTADEDISETLHESQDNQFKGTTLLTVHGNIDAGENQIKASYVHGTARDAEKWSKEIDFTLSGDVIGTTKVDGHDNVTIVTTLNETGNVVSKAYLNEKLAKLKVGGMKVVTDAWKTAAEADPEKAYSEGIDGVTLEEGIIYLIPTDADDYSVDPKDPDYRADKNNYYEEWYWEFKSKTWVEGTTTTNTDGSTVTTEGHYDYDGFEGKFEHIGNTSVNLQDYVSHTNLKNGYNFDGPTYTFGTQKDSTTINVYGDLDVSGTTSVYDINSSHIAKLTDLFVSGSSEIGSASEEENFDYKTRGTLETIYGNLEVKGQIIGNVDTADKVNHKLTITQLNVDKEEKYEFDGSEDTNIVINLYDQALNSFSSPSFKSVTTEKVSINYYGDKAYENKDSVPEVVGNLTLTKDEDLFLNDKKILTQLDYDELKWYIDALGAKTKALWVESIHESASLSQEKLTAWSAPEGVNSARSVYKLNI